MITNNIIQNLSTLTKVPAKVFTNLINKENLCIGSAVHDAMLNNEEATVLNIGIGTLSVDLKTAQCKFIPSKDLKLAIKRAISEKIDPLEYELEQELINKLLAISDEVL